MLALGKAVEYHLHQTKSACCQRIHRALQGSSYIFQIKNLADLVSFLGKDEYCQSELWDAVSQHLPEYAQDQEVEALLESSTLAALLCTEILRKDIELKRNAEKRQYTETKKAISTRFCFTGIGFSNPNLSKCACHTRRYLKIQVRDAFQNAGLIPPEN
jgi:hypothetical protein